MNTHARHNARLGGFTLLELTVVIFLIAIMAALAFPRLVDVMSFSELEGEARHLAAYGRAAVAEASLFREDVVVRFDLDRQEYWSVKLVYPEPESGEGEGEQPPDQMELLSKMRGQSGMSGADLSGMLTAARMKAAASPGGKLDGMPDGFDDEAANTQMGDKFDRFARRVLEERAKNVKQDQGLLDEIGPLFDKQDKFHLSLDEEEPEEVELADATLQRVLLTEGVRIESVIIDGAASNRGTVEVRLSPLGLSSEIGFYVVNDDGDYYTVVWDPVTGGTNIYDGKQNVG